MPSDDSNAVIHSLPRAAPSPPTTPSHTFRSLLSPWRAPPRRALVRLGARASSAARRLLRVAG